MKEPFTLNGRVWVLTKLNLPELGGQPLQGFAIAGAVEMNGAGIEESSLLIVEQQGRLAPRWVRLGDIARSEAHDEAGLGVSRGGLFRSK